MDRTRARSPRVAREVVACQDKKNRQLRMALPVFFMGVVAVKQEG